MDRTELKELQDASFNIFENLVKDAGLELSPVAGAYLQKRIRNEEHLLTLQGITALFEQALDRQKARAEMTTAKNRTTGKVICIQDLKPSKKPGRTKP